MSHQSENCRSVCACVISTPFGRAGRARREQHVADVVAAAPRRCARSTAASSTSSPEPRNAPSEWSAFAGVVETDDECSRSGSAARSSASVAA